MPFFNPAFLPIIGYVANYERIREPHLGKTEVLDKRKVLLDDVDRLRLPVLSHAFDDQYVFAFRVIGKRERQRTGVLPSFLPTSKRGAVGQRNSLAVRFVERNAETRPF